jgi:hypothetical protein
MPVLETLHAEVEAIEDSGFSKPAKEVDVERLYMIRRGLLRIRNAVAPLVEVCRRLEHAEVMPIAPAMQPLFRDVTDHVLRVQEEIDSVREVFEASLMRGQAQQTAITRRLAAWAPTESEGSSPGSNQAPVHRNFSKVDIAHPSRCRPDAGNQRRYKPFPDCCI